jgi:hypothetical protein
MMYSVTLCLSDPDRLSSACWACTAPPPGLETPILPLTGSCRRIHVAAGAWLHALWMRGSMAESALDMGFPHGVIWAEPSRASHFVWTHFIFYGILNADSAARRHPNNVKRFHFAKIIPIIMWTWAIRQVR